MTKGSTVQKREIFIREMIPVENVAGMIQAYRKAYVTCKTDSGARVQAYKLLQIPAIVKAIDEGKKKREELIRRAQEQEIERLARIDIISQTQIEAVLSQIAIGKYRRKKVVAAIDIKAGKVIKGEVEEAPTETDMISAADKLLRIKGAYAPNVLKHDGTDKFLEFIRGFADVNNPDIPQYVQPGDQQPV